MEPLILCDNLVKIYKLNDIEVVALQGLDRPSAGRVLVAGNDLLQMSNIALNGYRRRFVGFVWQQKARNLIPYLNAEQNVEMPMIMRSVAGRERRAWMRGLIEAAGL